MEILAKADSEVEGFLKPLVDKLMQVNHRVDYPGYPPNPGIWYNSNMDPIGESLNGFIGYLDLETTGLTQQDRVTAGVGVGFLNGEQETVMIRFDTPKLVQIHNCVIANWNQPYDRQYYTTPDNNTHIDLMGLCMAVRGGPTRLEWKYGGLQTWEKYCHKSLSLKNVLMDRLGIDLDKSVREDIVKGTASIESIVEYCFRDTLATVQVGCIVLREYLDLTPSYISLMGHITRHSFVIPMSPKFEGYWERVEGWYEGETKKKNAYVQELVWESLIPSCVQHESIHLNYPDRYQTKYLNGWLKFMGAPVYSKGTKSRKPRVKQPKWGYRVQLQLLGLACLVSEESTISTFLPKYLWELQGKNFHPATRIYGLIIPLEWLGNPVTYDRGKKEWIAGGEVMPNLGDDSSALSSPLSKDYLARLGEGLTSSEISQDFVDIIKNTLRWSMFRDRIKGIESRDGWFIPCYSPTGTLSNRSVDKLMLLFGSPKFDKGGSELMSFIEAKPGYKIVMADLDGAEFVLAGLVACSVAGITEEDGHPLARANLLGEKSSGTDVHSIVAKQMGIDRGGAKTRVYAALYGEGFEAMVRGLMAQLGCDRVEAKRLAELFTQSFVKGLASDFFTGLRLMSDCLLPTRLLSREVPLAYRHGAKEMGTSIRNHQIQSLGVDWLDTIQTLVMLECSNLGIDAVLVLTRHDELIYHVAERDVEVFSTILQMAHRVSKFAICHQFGVTKPNEKWSYFSEVDVFERYRKDPTSNPSTVTTQF
jgi:DNA polymerase gamma 1